MKARKVLSLVLVFVLTLGAFSFIPASEQEAYAASATVKVAFNSQGGTTVKTKPVTQGKKIGVLKTPTNKNFTFKGWYTKPVGGEKITKNTKVTKNTTYYAQWKIKKGFVQASFKTSGYSIYKAYKKNAKLGSAATKTIKRTGYTFKGWYTAQTGGKKLSSSVTIKKHTTYYAKWTANQYTLFYDANEGSLAQTYKNVTFGKAYGELPTPIRSGYTFKGWYTAKTGGKQVTASTKSTVAGSTIIYAQWNKIPSKISQNLTISLESNRLVAGRQYPLKVTGKGAITYRSSNTEVATVSNKGVVTAIKPGYVTIFAEVGGANDPQYNFSNASLNLTVAGGDTQQYKYEIFLLNQHKIYTQGGSDALVYIKTNNPDPSRIAVFGASISANNFDDVKYVGNSGGILSPVEGGYIVYCQPGEAGPQTISIWEAYEGCSAWDIQYYHIYANTEYAALFGCNTNVKIGYTAYDKTTAYNAWVNDIIAKNTKSSMTFHQKMSSVQDYILTNYHYPPNTYGYEERWGVLRLLSQHGASWDLKELDSASSPALLYTIAVKLGCPKENIVRLSGDMHAYIQMTYDGTTVTYCACPSMTTNSFDPTKIKPFDFSRY